MSIRNKKTFELSSIKKYKQYERKLWLIPLACLLFGMIGICQKAIHDLMEDPSIATVLGVLLFLLIWTLISSSIPFLAGKILIGIKRKTAIQNCTITSMQDFEYYRDKLTGLSPADISILTDLEIEQTKDVAASILQYENLGLLVEDADHTYHMTKKYESYHDLKDSDRYLIEHLEKGDFDRDNDTQWKQLVMDEAVSEGYITQKAAPWLEQPKRENVHQKKTVSKKWHLIQILLGAVWICWLLNAYPRLAELQQYMQVPLNENVAEYTKFVYSQPKVILGGIESIALFLFAIFILCYKPGAHQKMHSDSKKGFAVLGIWLCLLMLSLPTLLEFDELLETAPENASFAEQMNFLYSQPKMMLGFVLIMVVIIYTMYLIAYAVAILSPEGTSIMKSIMQQIKRTDYGNQMAECIYGMKNFIHDYSNLSMADKRQVVLWEDYLVYAVVLEENEEIVNEISKTRREVL